MNAANDIVVVDDNPTLLILLSEIFREHGYTVRTAADGFAALAVIRDRIPTVLLSDLYMQGMSGFELLSVVRRRFPVIAAVAMSGAYSGEDVPAGVAADGFYAKGSSSPALLFRILAAIGDQGLRQSRRAQAPIWVPALPFHDGERSTMSVACPECLRPFAHFLHEGLPHERDSNCPHCSCSVKLAIVRAAKELDATTIPNSMTSTNGLRSSLDTYCGSALHSEQLSR
jgi:CheY-like chemotaxis protein